MAKPTIKFSAIAFEYPEALDVEPGAGVTF